MASYRALDQDLGQVSVTMNAAQQQARLAHVVLHVDIDTTSDKKLGSVFMTLPTGVVQGSGRRGVQHIGFTTSMLDETFQGVRVTQGGGPVQHCLLVLVV